MFTGPEQGSFARAPIGDACYDPSMEAGRNPGYRPLPVLFWETSDSAFISRW